MLKMDDTEKTKDVEINEDVSFCDMMLSERVLAGLKKCNFEKPSPIQLRAIPIGRCGLDLIIQSKSGTGKTLVFCTIILERYDPELKTPQSLIVVPTREIALQVESYLKSIGSCSPGFTVASVIGGRDIADDRRRISKCKAIVGTPGRILHLIVNNCVCLQNIKTLVLDEADKLVTDNFYHDINTLLNALNKNRQIIASSATYANGLDRLIVSLMHNPIAVSTARDTPVLIGVKQFLLPVDTFSVKHTNPTPSIRSMWRKVSAVEYILSTVSFKQCILFSNSQFRADSFANYLTQNKWTVELALGSHDQSTRTATIQKIRQYKSRILVTTDLMARGVDIVNINLVINLDVPSCSSTYLHRIGRCGRFGRRGLAITLVDGETEMKKFQNLLETIGSSKMNVEMFPIDLNTNFDVWASTCRSSDVADSCIFGSTDNVSSTQGHEQLNRDKNVSLDDKPNQIEARNMNLFEMARVMIDTDASKTQSTVDLDIDLFSNFANKNDTSTKSVSTHELSSMQETNGNVNETDCVANGHKKTTDEQNNNLDLLEITKLLIAAYPETNLPAADLSTDLFSSYDNRNDEKPSVSTHVGPTEYYYGERDEQGESIKLVQNVDNYCDDNDRITEKEKNLDKIEKNQENRDKIQGENGQKEKNQEIPFQKGGKLHNQKNNHQEFSNTDGLSIANRFWAQMYWKQLSDINQYVLNSDYKFNRNPNF